MNQHLKLWQVLLIIPIAIVLLFISFATFWFHDLSGSYNKIDSNLLNVILEESKAWSGYFIRILIGMSLISFICVKRISLKALLISIIISLIPLLSLVFMYTATWKSIDSIVEAYPKDYSRYFGGGLGLQRVYEICFNPGNYPQNLTETMIKNLKNNNFTITSMNKSTPVYHPDGSMERKNESIDENNLFSPSKIDDLVLIAFKKTSFPGTKYGWISLGISSTSDGICPSRIEIVE